MERSSFKKYFDIYYLPICMYALRLLGNKEEAEDVVQSCFASAWERLQNGVEISEMKSYLYGTARNLAYSKLRSSKKLTDEPLAEAESEDVAEEDIDTSERDAKLWKAIGELPEKCRLIFLMSKRDGFSNIEIAEELGLLDRVLSDGWSSLSARETGRIGGMLRQRNQKQRNLDSPEVKMQTADS